MCDAWTWENDKEGNSRIPDDLLPAVRWYPDVNDMGFAIGYESDAAYESTYSKLLYHGASLTQTDAGTCADWRKSYEAGFKPVGDIEDPYFDTNTPSRIVQSCNLSTRVIVPPELVREAESLVPEGTGRFWPNGSAADTESEALSAAAFRELIAMPDWKYRRQIAGHDLNDFKRTGQWLGGNDSFGRRPGEKP